MALYRVPAGIATQVRPITSQLRSEKSLQRLIEANLETLFGVRFVATEFATGQKHRGRIDTLGLDQDGSAVIIEYKLTSNENVMNQGLFYLDWLLDHRGDFELAARSQLGEIDVTWTAPRLILLASSFSRYDQYAVNRIDERIELWTYTLYEGDLLSVELLSSEEVPSPKAVSSTTKRKAERAQPVKPGFDLTHHHAKMSATTRNMFELLQREILDLGDDVTERVMNHYVGYRRLKNFCEIVGQRKKLNVFIDGPVQDSSGICEDVSGIGHWGTGSLRATVASESDVVTLLPLITSAYALQE
jgi:predicted transport protein